MAAKYLIVIPDGAADEPIEQLGNKTIFEAAIKPNIDRISLEGRQGMVRTVPGELEPGSDVAMMSLLGYNPMQYYTGRAPIEAVARGIEMSDTDWVFRCNLVTIADGKMADHSAGHISTKEGSKLIAELDGLLGSEKVKFFPGVSYRHLLLFKDANFEVVTRPPHDFIGEPIEKLLPRGKGSEQLIELMARSQIYFDEHDINRVRRDLGENPVSSIWLWGQGKRAKMEKFADRFGVKGAAITAVDLVRGLAKLIDFDLIPVEGATGFVDTNYTGKAQAAIKALKDHDIVLVHVEAPDEAGHSGNWQVKKKAVELIDKHIVGPVMEELKKYEQWRILVMPDHPTPVASQAHSNNPVPFTMAGTNMSGVLHKPFSEANATESGFKVENGWELMEYFLKI